MAKIPLARILKGRLLRIAELQDLLVIELLKKFDLILHGDTAVWRIYGGKRFSYDVDIYYSHPEDVGEYLSSIDWARLTKKRITRSGRAYFRIEKFVPVELEVSPPPEGAVVTEGDFWLVDGTSMVVKTLTPEELVREKVEAFISRKKARDLYDIYYLLDLCNPEEIKGSINRLLPALNMPPKDYLGLKETILIGAVPSFESLKRKVMAYAED